MDTVIGLDIGTSGTKGVLLDSSGRILAEAEQRYPLMSPRPGWAEQDPADWWRAAVHVLRELADVARSHGTNPAAIGLTGQMNGAVLLDGRLEVIRPCIIWADTRTAAECELITRRVGAGRLTEITGHLAVTGYTAPKILWVREREPEHYAAIAHVLLPKDYIRFRLTGELATDPSDASNTVLFDITRIQWSDDILRELDLPAKWFPPIVPSAAVAGHLDPEAARLTGLPDSTLVVAGAGDSIAEAVGSGMVDEGPVLSVIGSAGNISATCRRPVIDPAGRIHTGCHAMEGRWIVTGVQQAAGLSLAWLVEGLRLGELLRQGRPDLDGYELLMEQAALASPGAGGLIFLPYLAGERTPHLDPHARGVIFGLTRNHGVAELARAVLEGVAYAQKDSLELLRGLGISTSYVLASGGGSRSACWQQVLADVFGLGVAREVRSPGAAFGAALLASVGAGWHATVEAASRACVRVHEEPLQPRAEYRVLYDRAYVTFRELYLALKPLFARTSI